MIRILYDGESTVSVYGHAGSGQKGRDLVCAAVTTLVLTLSESCRECRLRPGYAYLSGGSQEVFRAIGLGFAMLEEMSPQCVRYERRGGLENRRRI